ncbi:hypothetical protein DP804_23115 [Salmonella enterica subsp. enterica]|nr:hypothetical protein [Salmonella enterica subsp. enterica serovar Virchow]
MSGEPGGGEGPPAFCMAPRPQCPGERSDCVMTRQAGESMARLAFIFCPFAGLFNVRKKMKMKMKMKKLLAVAEGRQQDPGFFPHYPPLQTSSK